MTRTVEFPLVGGGGEPVDLRRTLTSHGYVDLPPMKLAPDERSIEITMRVRRGRPRTVRIHDGRDGHAAMTVLGPAVASSTTKELARMARHMLRMDADLSGFYAMTASDPDLSWVASGAGRMVRGATVFEDVVKTVCTTNCAWSATKRMVNALVEHLGEPAPGAPPHGPQGRAFPTPEVMAANGDRFYREVVRAGYRGSYLRSIAARVAAGELDLDALGAATPEELPDDELEADLLALPGVGPYAAATIMLTMGRYSRLILDSWSRPTYAALVGKKQVADRTIVRRFRRYGRYAGLAFWLFLTRDWVE